jgi:signal transduction histidine kinase
MFLDFKRDKWAFIITFSLNVVFVLFFDPIHYLLGIDMASFGLHLDYYHLMTQNSITFLINISMAFAFFKVVSSRYEEKILRLNGTLNNKNQKIERQNSEIMRQNEELYQQREEIYSLNNHLEGLVTERTQKLQASHAQIREYAFLNAHKLRAPIATILGLYEVLDLVKDTEEQPKILQKLRETVVKLDMVVHEMQKVLEDDETGMP